MWPLPRLLVRAFRTGRDPLIGPRPSSESVRNGLTAPPPNALMPGGYRSHAPRALAPQTAGVQEWRCRKVIGFTPTGFAAMSHLTVVSANPAMGYPPGAQAAHDLRNLLATIGLHLETLQRLSGPAGAKAADAAHALLSRCSALCNGALERAAHGDARARRKGVDVSTIVRQVADLLAPSAPAGFSFDIAPEGTVSVLADSDDVFRILFNLMGNAVAVANRRPGKLTSVAVRACSEGTTVTLQVSDDGPGLPAAIRSSLFGARARTAPSAQHGHGLTIARELAERNGGTLTLVRSERGAAFALVLPAFLSMIRADAPGYLARRSAPFLPASATAAAEKS
jgi:hypothetical protein